MNTKAQLIQFLPYILVGIVVLFIFAIVVVPIADVSDQLISELSRDENFGTSERANESMQQVGGLVTPAFDQLIFIIMMSVVLGAIALAIFSDFSPVLIGSVIISLVLMIIVGGLLSETYTDVSQDATLSDKGQDFTLTNAIMGSQFPIIILVTGIIVLIILFAKRGRVISPV